VSLWCHMDACEKNSSIRAAFFFLMSFSITIFLSFSITLFLLLMKIQKHIEIQRSLICFDYFILMAEQTCVVYILMAEQTCIV
jgi:hypothetical protein